MEASADLKQAVGHATAISLRQAKEIALTNNAAGPSVPNWKNEDCVASDALTKNADSASVTVTNDVKSKQVIFQVDPVKLTADYDVVYVTAADSSQATNFLSAVAYLRAVPLRYALAASIDPCHSAAARAIGGRLMDRNEVEHVARVSGKEAAQETLIGLGIDTTKPIETQRDFAHLRWWREIAEGVMKAAVIAMALGFGGTLATLVWLGFKISLSQ